MSNPEQSPEAQLLSHSLISNFNPPCEVRDGDRHPCSLKDHSFVKEISPRLLEANKTAEKPRILIGDSTEMRGLGR